MDSSAIIAGLALAVSVVSLWLSHRETKKQREIAESQRDVAVHQARLQRDLDLVRWGQEAVDALSDAWHLACDDRDGRTGDKAIEQRRAVAMRLSSLVDKGRFFLANLKQDEFRPDLMPKSRRGYRHAALDELVSAYNALENWDACAREPHAKRCEAIYEMRRWFVDAIVNEIGPTLHFSRFEKITQRQQQDNTNAPAS